MLTELSQRFLTPGQFLVWSSSFSPLLLYGEGINETINLVCCVHTTCARTFISGRVIRPRDNRWAVCDTAAAGLSSGPAVTSSLSVPLDRSKEEEEGKIRLRNLNDGCEPNYKNIEKLLSFVEQQYRREWYFGMAFERGLKRTCELLLLNNDIGRIIFLEWYSREDWKGGIFNFK